MEVSSFFNSINHDRRYKAEDWANYFSSFIGNGIFGKPSNSLQLLAASGMSLTMKEGKAWINGYFYKNTGDLTVTIATADGVLKRIDRIVIRWSITERTIKMAVKAGTPSANPTAPVLQRDADTYELAIADVFVGAGATNITQANITDRRFDTALCGVVTGVVQQFDISSYSAQFDVWFESVKNTLTGDVAGNLLLLITQNQNRIEERGVPNGGVAGKVLRKASGDDFDVEWCEGQINQMLPDDYALLTAEQRAALYASGVRLISMNNGKLIRISNSGNATDAVSLNGKQDVIGSTNAEEVLNALGTKKITFEEIWAGAWKSGTVTIGSFNPATYQMYRVSFGGQICYCNLDGNNSVGYTLCPGYVFGNEDKTKVHITSALIKKAVSSYVWTMERNTSILLTVGAGITQVGESSITKIWGVIKT